MNPLDAFMAQLADEARRYPRFFLLLLMAHCLFLGFCVGRLT